MTPHAKPKGRQCSHARYLLSCEQFEQLRTEADDRCQICGRRGEDTGHRHLVIDHDAFVGDWAVRGLLCSSCNNHIEYKHRNGFGADYLANAWYLRMLAVLGLTSSPSEEPVPGSTVRCGRRRWTREPDGWVATDKFGRGRASWHELHRRFGPHNLEVLPIPPRPEAG